MKLVASSILKFALKLAFILFASSASLGTFASDSGAPAHVAAIADSAQMEKDLQRLDWKQFRAVVEAIPKLKADVDAYGPAGWDFVKANYRFYHWKKNIDRLDASQKQELAALIEKARSRR